MTASRRQGVTSQHVPHLRRVSDQPMEQRSLELLSRVIDECQKTRIPVDDEALEMIIARKLDGHQVFDVEQLAVLGVQPVLVVDKAKLLTPRDPPQQARCFFLLAGDDLGEFPLLDAADRRGDLRVDRLELPCILQLLVGDPRVFHLEDPEVGISTPACCRRDLISDVALPLLEFCHVGEAVETDRVWLLRP